MSTVNDLSKTERALQQAKVGLHLTNLSLDAAVHVPPCTCSVHGDKDRNLIGFSHIFNSLLIYFIYSPPFKSRALPKVAYI